MSIVAIGNPEKHVQSFAQSFALWQQAAIEIMLAISLTIACSRYIYNGVIQLIRYAYPVRGESHNQRNTTGEVATTSPPFYNEPHRCTFLVWRLNSARPPHPGHSNILLRSEIPIGMCRNLRTVAATNVEIMLATSFTIACPCYTYNCVIIYYIYYSSRIYRSWWITQSTQHHRRGCNSIMDFVVQTPNLFWICRRMFFPFKNFHNDSDRTQLLHCSQFVCIF